MKNAMIGVLLVLVGALATMLFLSLSHSRRTTFTAQPAGSYSLPQTQTPLRVEPNQPKRNIEAASQLKGIVSVTKDPANVITAVKLTTAYKTVYYVVLNKKALELSGLNGKEVEVQCVITDKDGQKWIKVSAFQPAEKKETALTKPKPASVDVTHEAGIRIFGTYNAAIPRFVRALPGGGWGMYYYEGDSWTYGDTGYATSNDGITWNRVGRVMTHGGHGFDNVNAVITDVVNLSDGNLRAYCEGLNSTSYDAQSNIFIADSTDGINWVNRQVVFVPQSGTLYSRGVGCPRVAYVGGEYTMYFVGSDDTTSRIFKTTSSDGIINWTSLQMVVEPPTGGSLGSFYIVNCPEAGRFRMFISTKFSTGSGNCIRSLISMDNGSSWTWEDGIRLAPDEYSVENLICPVLVDIGGSDKMYIGGGHGGAGGGHWDTLSATCE